MLELLPITGILNCLERKQFFTGILNVTGFSQTWLSIIDKPGCLCVHWTWIPLGYYYYASMKILMSKKIAEEEWYGTRLYGQSAVG
jgi:hypothetical protein